MPAMAQKTYSISKRYSWGVPNSAPEASGNPNNLLATSGRIAWLAELDTSRAPAKEYRRTSIICTIGPKTNSVESINKLRTVSGSPATGVCSRGVVCNREALQTRCRTGTTNRPRPAPRVPRRLT